MDVNRMTRPALRRTMLSMPLAYPSTLDRAATGCASAMMVVLRGGALEPDRASLPGNRQAKAHAISRRDFQADAQRIFLSQAGPQFLRLASQAGHHPSHSKSRFASETTKATHWVALAQAVLRLASSAYASLREPVRNRTRSYRLAAPKSTARRRSRGRPW
jgi:hypothetical protein